MLLQRRTEKKDLEQKSLKERISYGYQRVIMMMILSGILSIVIIGILTANVEHYVKKVERADSAVKICRLDVNSAARNIREMALNSDTSTYADYEKNVKKPKKILFPL